MKTYELPKDIIKLAIDTLNKNKECLVAQFIIQNPDTKIEGIELVQENKSTEIIFSVRKKTY